MEWLAYIHNLNPLKDAKDMLGSTLAQMEPQPTKREKLLTKNDSVGKNQQSGNFRTLPIDEKVTRMRNQTHWSSTLLISFLSFSMNTNLFKMIGGSDMNMTLNHFCKFL